jgi:hypothetical protein
MIELLRGAVLGAVTLVSVVPAFADDGSRAALAAVDCWEPDAVFKQCAKLGPDGKFHLEPSYRARLRFGPHDLAAVNLLGVAGAEKGRWFYVRSDGVMAPVMTYDAGPEDFPEGLARSPVGERIGYIDRTLKLVIPARYDGAYPFEQGAAVVCLGCAVVSHGGHSWYEGGEWGCIDPGGNELAPFRSWEKGLASRALCVAEKH